MSKQADSDLKTHHHCFHPCELSFPPIGPILALLPKAAEIAPPWTNSHKLCARVCVFKRVKGGRKKDEKESVRVCAPACECTRGWEQCGYAADIIHLPVTGPGAAGKVADTPPLPQQRLHPNFLAAGGKTCAAAAAAAPPPSPPSSEAINPAN